VETHAQAGLGKPECRGTAGDTSADNRDVDAAVVRAALARRDGFFEPVRIQDVER